MVKMNPIRPSPVMTIELEKALRWAADCHRGQFRRGSDVPYVEHVAGVAMILDRLGFDQDVVIAGLLHDVVEDTDATLDQVEARFGPEVADTVRQSSEIKTDAQGRKRPWIDRKRDHLEALAGSPVAARAVVLADKLHNLISIELDLREGRPVWAGFHADRAQVLWYYRTAIEQFGTDDPRLKLLAQSGREALERVEALGDPDLQENRESPGQDG
jgi:(p)ppGpp synthase/HD superfamily hydrolase